MNEKVLNHYKEFSTYTYPGLYQDALKKLPDNIREVGLLVRKSLIHRTTLEAGNIGTNKDLRFGDMNKVPWWRQPEDDILITAASMIAELYHRDKRGFVLDRTPENKLVLMCRSTTVLIASILKSKGIPTRCRAGHASYFSDDIADGLSWDHWINQYWSEKENRWVSIDVDGSLSISGDLDPYDMPDNTFDFAAHAWLGIRSNKLDGNRFSNGDGTRGAIVVFWSLFLDFHCLMNNEIIYSYGPACGYGNPAKFAKLTSPELEKIDHLARLMQKPDDNFDELTKIWETDKSLRLLSGGLL